MDSHPAKSRPMSGFSTPAVGFEAPFDMLEACHERVAVPVHHQDKEIHVFPPGLASADKALQWQAMSADMMSRRGVIGQVAETPATTLEPVIRRT